MKSIKYLSLSLLLFTANSLSSITAQECEQHKTSNTMESKDKTPLKSKLDEKKSNFELKADNHKKKIYKEGRF